MKIVFISHPVGGDVEENLVRIGKIVREINRKEPGVIPYVPYFADCHVMNDDEPRDRARGLNNSLMMIKYTEIDELRLYGDTISVGMWMEIAEAMENAIDIVPMTDGTRDELKKSGVHYEG